jgi:hypothetical protein
MTPSKKLSSSSSICKRISSVVRSRVVVITNLVPVVGIWIQVDAPECIGFLHPGLLVRSGSFVCFLLVVKLCRARRCHY